MILIPASEIKTFLKRSSKIKPNMLIPVLENIRLECVGDTATMTKSNMNAWCIHQVQATFKQNETLLLSEKFLSALVSSSVEEIISIAKEDDNIVLACGKYKVAFAYIDPTTFPDPPEMNQENGTTSLPAELLYSIRAALSLTDTSIDNSFNRCYVSYVNGKTEVFSTRGYLCYLKTFPDRFPALTISPSDGALITSFEEVVHYEANNYDFYDCGTTTYGFVKSTYKPPGYQTLFRNATNTEFFEVCRQELVGFLQLVMKSTPVPFPTVCISDNGMLGVTFEHSDAEFRISTKMSFEGEKNYSFDRFELNAKALLELLDSIEAGSVRMSPTGSKVYSIWVKDDSSIAILLAGIGTK